MRVMSRIAEDDSAELLVHLREGLIEMALGVITRGNVEFDALQADVLDTGEIVFDDLVSAYVRPIDAESFYDEAEPEEREQYRTFLERLADENVRLFRDPDTLPYREGEDMRGWRSASYQCDLLMHVTLWGLLDGGRPWIDTVEALGLSPEHLEKIAPAVEEGSEANFKRARGEYQRQLAERAAAPHTITRKGQRQQRL